MFIYQLEQDRDWSEPQALLKCWEEFNEFSKASENDSDEEILEEGFDVIQTIFSYFETRGFTTEEISAGLKRHNDKLEARSWDRRAIYEVKEVE